MNKTTIGAIIMMFVSMVINCDNEASESSSYSKLFFKRDGGGNKAFYITTNSHHEILLHVTRYDFKDTNYTQTIFINDSGKTSQLISDVLLQRVTIVGDFKHSTQATGTWTSLYVVSDDSTLTEITNRAVRDTIVKLESFVEKTR